MKNPKAKGNGFERVVAKLLSDWAGVKFMRTPASGAIHNFKDKRVVSDIVPPLSIGKFPFSIECKKVECSWEFSTLLEGTSQTLKQHWKQCTDDATREGLVPLLIFTKNFREIYAMMRLDDFLVYSTDTNLTPRMTLYLPESSPLMIFRLKDFLATTTCNELVNQEQR